MPNNALPSGLPVHVIVTAEALDEEMRPHRPPPGR
jgi:hypothetical protein